MKMFFRLGLHILHRKSRKNERNAEDLLCQKKLIAGALLMGANKSCPIFLEGRKVVAYSEKLNSFSDFIERLG